MERLAETLAGGLPDADVFIRRNGSGDATGLTGQFYAGGALTEFRVDAEPDGTVRIERISVPADRVLAVLRAAAGI